MEEMGNVFLALSAIGIAAGMGMVIYCKFNHHDYSRPPKRPIPRQPSDHTSDSTGETAKTAHVQLPPEFTSTEIEAAFRALTKLNNIYIKM